MKVERIMYNNSHEAFYMKFKDIPIQLLYDNDSISIEPFH